MSTASKLTEQDREKLRYSDQIQQVVNEALDEARAAIAVIAARIGCEVQA